MSTTVDREWRSQPNLDTALHHASMEVSSFVFTGRLVEPFVKTGSAMDGKEAS
jgi:hypothetical protein